MTQQSEHLGSLKARNFTSFDFAALLLHTKKDEGEEFLLYNFPQGQKVQKFQKLKGVFLACTSVAKAVLGKQSSLYVFQLIDQANKRHANKDQPEAMINNVKVRPVIDVDQIVESDRYFKASFSSIKKECLQIVIVLPFSVPDNIVKNAASEAKICLNQLIKPGFFNQLQGENQDEVLKIQKRLNTVFTNLFYQVQVLAHHNFTNDSAFSASPLGVTPLSLPIILESSSQNASMVSVNLSEKLLIDASEFLNAVYEDMSQINEILTLKDQTLIIEGSAMFYKGFTIVNSLENIYLKPLIRIANLYDMFERSQSSPEEVIIDYYYLKTKRTHQAADDASKLNQSQDSTGVLDLSADASLEADDDYVRQVLEQGAYMKFDDDNNEDSEQKKEKLETSKDEDEDDEDKGSDKQTKRNDGPKMNAQTTSGLNKVDKEFKKLLNEIEVRFRKEDPADIKEKRLRKLIQQGKIRKLVTLIGRGQLLLGVVCHVLADDNTGEFDPYFIERMKNSLQLMLDKHFAEVIENDLTENNCFSVKKESSTVDKKVKQQQQQHIDFDPLESSRRGDKKKGQVVQDPNTPAQVNEFLNRQSAFGLKKTEFLSQQRTLNTIIGESPQQDRKSAISKNSNAILSQLDSEFKLATISLQQIVGHHTRKRSGSITGSKQFPDKQLNSNKIVSSKGQIAKIVPLIDTISGVKIYHFACYNLYYSSILTRNVEASPQWFKLIQREIYNYYAQIVSSVLPTLDKKQTQQQKKQKEEFDDVMDYIDNQLDSNKLGKFDQKYFKDKGQQLYKVWEQGIQVDLPIFNDHKFQNMSSIWIVCRILNQQDASDQKPSKTESKLNLKLEQDDDSIYNKAEEAKNCNNYQMVFLAYENNIMVGSSSTSQVRNIGQRREPEPVIANITNIAYKLSLLNFF